LFPGSAVFNHDLRAQREMAVSRCHLILREACSIGGFTP
jgi:hypothetical protein